MSIPFKEPCPKMAIKLSKEKSALTRHFSKRKVPKSKNGNLLLASWNIANLGAQHRNKQALQMVAHILQRFDLIAVQEVNQNFHDMLRVIDYMNGKFEYVMSDTAGNTERLAYIYRSNKVEPRNLFGEIALRKREYPERNVTVRYTEKKIEKKKIYKVRFQPFDRNPYIGTFVCQGIDLTLVNVHLYFGKFQNSRKQEDHLKYCRRVLEIYAMVKWADRRKKDEHTYDQDIILLGDMNVPQMNKKESTYKMLTKFGLQPLHFLNRTGGDSFSNIANTKTYDQVVFTPGAVKGRVLQKGVFDFDNAIFKQKWKELQKSETSRKALSTFNRYVKHHVSDHRLVWIELDVAA